MYLACQEGHLDIARILYAKGAKVNVVGEFFEVLGKYQQLCTHVKLIS